MSVRRKEEQENTSEDDKFMHHSETEGLNADWVQSHTPQIPVLS